MELALRVTNNYKDGFSLANHRHFTKLSHCQEFNGNCVIAGTWLDPATYMCVCIRIPPDTSRYVYILQAMHFCILSLIHFQAIQQQISVINYIFVQKSFYE